MILNKRIATNFFLCIAILFSLLAIPLNIFGIYIPNFFALVTIAIVILFYFEKYNKTEIRFLAVIGLFLLVSVFLTPGINIVAEKIKGFLQIIFSLTLFLSVFSVAKKIKQDRIKKVIEYSLFLFLALACLEIIGLIRPISDAFRSIVFAEDILYDNDRRDILLIGHIRPKVFTSEPSHATKIFFALAVSYSLLQKNKFFYKTVLIHLIGMYFFGSPIVLASLLLSIYLKKFHKIDISLRVIKYIFILLLILIIVVLWGDIIFPGIYSRFSNALISGGDGSVQQRIVFPYLTVFEVWKAGLPFGVGISGKEIVQNYSSLMQGGLDMLKVLGNNAISHSAIYFGFIGTPLFYGIIFSFIRKSGNINILSLIVIFFISGNIMGGLETPRFWILVGIIITVYLKIHSPTDIPFKKFVLKNDRTAQN